MTLKYDKPTIEDAEGKPVALAGRGYPYSQLEDRRFEELLYSIAKQRIEYGDWKRVYDEVNLLHGVKERGRDCSLHHNNKSYGLIQCKHSIHDTSRVSKPTCAMEIIKFALHSILAPSLIFNRKDFTYYYAVSYGFTEPAKDLIDDFNTLIIKETELREWTEKVISSNKSLEGINYDDIESDLTEILGSITVKKLVPTDLDLFLNKSGYESTIKTFFEVRTVVDSKAIDDLKEVVMDLGKYQDKSNIPIGTILKKFEIASHPLERISNTFDGVNDSHIERKEVKELSNWIKSPIKPEQRPIALLVGNAGCGKSVILKDLFGQLGMEKIPVIGLKADQYYVSTLRELEAKVDFTDTFEQFIRTVSEENERVVVLIDQIDALSQSSSANREYLDTFNHLVRVLWDIDKVRIIVSVRTYDLNYDSELKFYKNQQVFNVSLLHKEEVTGILGKLGVHVGLVSAQLFELLRTPHHLNVLCKIYNGETNLASIRTLYDLYVELWRIRIESTPAKSNLLSDKVRVVVSELADSMHKEQKISIQKPLYLERYKAELEYLKSTGIVNEIDGHVQFFHQTFYDFAFAKQFVDKQNSIIDFLVNNHQGLFIRSSVKMILAFLREHDSKSYIDAITEILVSNKFRFHIKLLLTQSMGFQESPTMGEKSLVINKIFGNSELEKIFLESIRTSEWLKFIFEHKILEGIIGLERKWYDNLLDKDWNKFQQFNLWIQNRISYLSYKERRQEEISFCLNILVKQLPAEVKLICDFILGLPEFEEKAWIVSEVLYRVKNWSCDEPFTLYEQYESQINTRRHTFHHIIEDSIPYRFDWALSKFRVHCLDITSQIQVANDKPRLEYQDEELLRKFFKANGTRTLDLALELVKDISNRTSSPDKSSLYVDMGFWLFDATEHDRVHDYETVYVQLIQELKVQAKTNSQRFREFVAAHVDSNSVTILRLLLFSFEIASQKHRDDIFDLMRRIHEKGGFNIDGKLQYQLRLALKEVYSHFSSSQKDELDEILLSVSHPSEFKVYSIEGKRGHYLKSFGIDKFKYLSSIPETEVLVRPRLRKVYQELKRKFNIVKDEEPNRIRFHGSSPPLKSSAYEKMSFEDWNRTFQKYGDTHVADWLEGSITEHSRKFQEEVKNRSAYFFPLIEKIIEDGTVSHEYISCGLTGLKEAGYNPTELQRLYKKALSVPFDREHTLYFIWISSYFIETEVLDEEVLDFLIDSAKHNPDPEEREVRNDPLTDGANNVRGAAAQRIVEVAFNHEFEDKIFEALAIISEDPHISVQASIMARMAHLMRLNEERTLKLFLKMVADEEIINYSMWTCQYLANRNFAQLQGFFKKAVFMESVQGEVAVVLAVAWLKGNSGSLDLLKQVLKRSDKAKVKAIDVAIRNMADDDSETRIKCHKLFTMFLNSENNEVVNAYDIGFLHLSPDNFSDIHPLLQTYAKSKVAQKGPHYFYDYLFKNTKRYPKECVDLLSRFNTYEKPDMSSHRYYDDEPIKVLMGAYNSLSSLEVKDKYYLEKSMELFDMMLRDKRLRNVAEKVVHEVEA